MSKDSEWSWAFEAEDEDANTSVSDTRVWTSDDTLKLEKENFRRCKSCRGQETIVVYHKSGANADGLVIHEELLCKSCGKYTQYHSDNRV